MKREMKILLMLVILCLMTPISCLAIEVDTSFDIGTNEEASSGLLLDSNIDLASDDLNIETNSELKTQAAFTPRLTAPTSSNSYYFSNNIFYKYGYGMPNCTAYAWGRAYELLGSTPNLSTGNANQWYGYNSGRYPSGSTPKLGAIACWNNGTYGHVAVVEEINGNEITISESDYIYQIFFRTRKLNTSSMGSGFQGYIYIGDFSNTPSDTTAPVVSKAWLDNQSGDGRMLHMEVSDNVNVSRVWCPTFAPGEGEGQYFSKDASRKEGSATEWMCAIFAADHGGKQGDYQTRIYAFDDAGNVSECYVIGYYIDKEVPVIKSVTVTNVSSTGYTVNCTFSDNIGIDRVMFPTWTESGSNNGQDDIIWRQGEVNGNTASCRIVISDFSFRKDNYITHVYVYDKALNAAVNCLNVDLSKGNDEVFGEATYKNSRYLLMDDSVTWDEAKAKAQAKGGHLAVITSQEEQNVISDLIKKGSQIQYFIGGLRSNGNFVWSTGESLSYTNWSSGEPNNYNNSENYISIYENGKWNDNANSALEGYIVEIETKQLIGHIDTPAQSSVIDSSTFLIQGWGIDENQISKFTYKINDGTEKELDRCDRPDVLKAYPSYNTSKPGFKETISSSELISGTNKIEVLAYTSNGVKTIGSVNVTKQVSTNSLTIDSFSVDKSSNQAIGTSLKLSASVSGGTSPYLYKFYANDGSTSTLIQDFSTNSTATFTPSKAGTYTLIALVTDNEGASATKMINNFVIYDNNSNDDVTEVDVSYRTHVQNEGWQDWKSDGVMSGTSGKGLRLEGIEINLNTDASKLGLTYTTHVQNIGWQDFVSNGEMSGTSGKGLRLEAIQISLTGSDADQYDIYYRVHAQNVGWLDWAKNGQSSGTAGFGYRLEGIEIKIVSKGTEAPGNTTKPYVES